ncbi:MULTISPECIES: helix-turn-helix domain-containing protein [unclassified Streptomyces]|uniref:helix-turn-helix domain-containing protein n=1 Tax=unclassified Streptomyces TaxID=2593676 RepID=UPI00363E3F1C
MMRPRSGPTVHHAVLAARLLSLRVGAGLSLTQAATALGAHRTTVMRIERAETALDAGQVRTLLERYGAGQEEIRQFLGELATANLPGWWHPWRDVMDPWALDLMNVESAARMVRLWHPALVPPLLRTPAYARAVEETLGAADRSPADRARRVELLTERRARLMERGTRIWALMTEAAVRTRVGDGGIMEEQLAALRDAAARPDVTLQVARLTDPPHPLTGVAGLTLYRVDVPEIPDHVVRESPVGPADVWSDTATVTAYRTLIDQACAAAPHPSAPLPYPVPLV